MVQGLGGRLGADEEGVPPPPPPLLCFSFCQCSRWLDVTLQPLSEPEEEEEEEECEEVVDDEEEDEEAVPLPEEPELSPGCGAILG